MVDTELIESVLSYKARGGEIFMRRNHTGLQKIKIRYGPLNMFTKRFEADHETFEVLKQKLLNC